MSQGERTMVFVYGSLKRGLGNHRVIEAPDTIDMGADILMYPGFMVDLGAFPGLVKMNEGIEQIHGEVYEVSPDTFSRLDMLEGYPRFYSREQRLTKNRHRVWVYFLPPDYATNPRVPHNNWRAA